MSGGSACPPAPARPIADEKQWVALTSVAAAVVLTGSKLWVGLATGSLGVLSEAAHSGLDLVAALVTCVAVRLSGKPADREHHYGHGKIESLSALIETVLLLVTCAWIVWEAVSRLVFRNVEVEVTVWSFIVVLVSIVVDVSRSRALLRVARQHGSQALEADGLHFSTDVWSSAVVLVGLAVLAVGRMTALPTFLAQADAVAALGVAAIVTVVSVRLGRRTIDTLLDRAPSGVVERVRSTVCGIEAVERCTDIRVRESGGWLFLDLCVAVSPEISVADGHRIADAARERIEATFPRANIVVHVDPAR